MINRLNILSAQPKTTFCKYATEEIYIADLTRRSLGTAHPRSVEVSQSQPIFNGQTVDSVLLHNSTLLDVEFGLFDDCKYEDFISHDKIEHCEGCFYIADNINWVTFFEIKDCDEKNILKYKTKAITQIANVVKDFKNRALLSSETILGIISFPRKHTAFNDTIFGDIIDYTNLKKQTGITYFATNEIFVVNADIVTPIIN